MACLECGGPTVWDDAAASDICTSCGRLTDPDQVLLTTHDFHLESALHNPDGLILRDPSGPNILKSRSSYTLAGQGQSARDHKNARTMANFIKNLAVSMNAPGLTPRATTLFTQAKAVNFFRWGTRARTVAGACLALALREASRPDSLHDIALLLHCSPSLLSRTFLSLVSALHIQTAAVDPSVYIGTLQGYLTSLLQESAAGPDNNNVGLGPDHQVPQGLPESLYASLRQIPIRAVANTALSLCRALSRLCPEDSSSAASTSNASHSVVSIPKPKVAPRPSAPSTACALFLLSIEAETRTPLPALADLAKVLADRLHIGKSAVMSQYKARQDQVAELAERIPWLQGYRQDGERRKAKGKGRAKVSKRTIVARALKDVVKFNEEILSGTLVGDLNLDLTADEEAEDQMYRDGIENSAPHLDNVNDADPSTTLSAPSDDKRAPKRVKLHHSLDEASRFLLNPFSRPSPLKSKASTSSTPSSRPSVSSFPLTSYILSSAFPSTSSTHSRAPTRLALLTAQYRTSALVPDDALFVDGELEGLMRSEEEVGVVQRLMWQEWATIEREREERDRARERDQMGVRKRKRTGVGNDQGQGQGKEQGAKKSRVDLEAFARFMRGDDEDREIGSRDPSRGGDHQEEDWKEDEGDFAGLLGLDGVVGLGFGSDKDDDAYDGLHRMVDNQIEEDEHQSDDEDNDHSESEEQDQTQRYINQLEDRVPSQQHSARSSQRTTPFSMDFSQSGSEEVVLEEEWTPASPGGAGDGYGYEEEYN